MAEIKAEKHWEDSKVSLFNVLTFDTKLVVYSN